MAGRPIGAGARARRQGPEAADRETCDAVARFSVPGAIVSLNVSTRRLSRSTRQPPPRAARLRLLRVLQQPGMALVASSSSAEHAPRSAIRSANLPS